MPISRPFLIFNVLFFISQFASAAPVLTVKGHATIRLFGLHRTGEGTVLSGQLQDRDLGTGVARRSVEVTYRVDGIAHRVRATTGEDGGFEVLLPGTGTAFQVEAQFGGDLNYAAEAAPAETLDVTKQTVEVELAGSGDLEATRPRADLILRARAEGQPVRVRLSLRTDRGGDLGQVETDARGEASLHVQTSSLGEPGRFTLYAHFAGNERYNPTTRRFALTLITPVQISLRALDGSVEHGDEIRLAGEVRDVTGPLAGATVHLDVMGRQTASSATDGAGRFTFRQSTADYPPGRLDLVARYAPAVSWRRPATSSAAEVMVIMPRPIPLRWYLAPALFTCLLLSALFIWRRGPLLLRRWRERRRIDHDDDVSRPVDEIEAVRSGLRPSRTSGGLRSLVRQSHDVWGTVWDPTDRRPVDGAVLQLILATGETLQVAADAEGRFALKALPAGVHRVMAARPGYVSEQFELAVPHRGHLHDVRVDLVQVRVRLLELYRDAAVGLLPDRELWARWTPRDLCRHVGSRAGRRHIPLEALTQLLEQAYWSGAAAEESMLVQARDVAGAVRHPAA